MPGSEKPPANWPGWPDGKKFALVLTHDVEGLSGVAKCKQLMELERSLGFRSCFSFIPQGGYSTSRLLRNELTRNGFEVGVHDLNHDGKLFQNARDFSEKATHINHYLKHWNAVGFRAGFMFHNLEWFHQLSVRYDASTFDTDPFEPQPDGVGTIFPFWVPRSGRPSVNFQQLPLENRFRRSTFDAQFSTWDHFDDCQSGGYVELPYTLPQDSTLFLLFRERTPDIWLQKLDWVAQHGGMALVNVHPDYLYFDGDRPAPNTFPVEFYADLLEYARDRYGDSFWHPLPREMADFVCNHRFVTRLRLSVPGHHLRRSRKIWIDLENTPHIPFFKPIVRELEKRGFDVVLTARDAFQTCEMATQAGLPYTKIGRHYGASLLLKVVGLTLRSVQLVPFVLKQKPVLALNHGARAQLAVSNSLRIPTVTIMDYEHSTAPPLARPLWEIVPDAISDEGMHCKNKDRVLKYSGIKEDVYAAEFRPNSAIVNELGLKPGNVIVVVRPPATEAHYHNSESEELFVEVMTRIISTPNIQAVLLPRNKRQEGEIRSARPEWFDASKVIIPDHVVDGMNLIWHSDLVVSGGGTMNREAAALGVPVYSIFRGKIGAVDQRLATQGRLTLLESKEDVRNKVAFQVRSREVQPKWNSGKALEEIIRHIETIIRHHYPD